MSGLFSELQTHLLQEQGIALATLVRGPHHVGAKLLLFPDASSRGTLGDATLDAQVKADAQLALWSGSAQLHHYQLANEAFEIFIEGFPPPPELIIVGAGHIAIPLTTIAKTLHYRVTIIDARAAFATTERFPHADEVIVAWPDEVLAQRRLSPSTAIAVLTHDPKFDEPTLKVVLERQVGYIGAIGSRKTSQERAKRLQSQGLTPEQLARIHGPIGLPIGAANPEEIALAIMAEIIAFRHQQAQ
ncbi:XdhC family protein [Tengunoibacter tsumagoiensis]|uniref:Xanthine and Co dehydrogenase maturation factor n=1 Tax=Tengunoibacter tsumagoiensis TaxID=2014871 RepID=A0A402A0R5_9CHLR|nr:XdhC/CoxI family protein [Tengunoibacter tsumagoiensis]GCE12601.1 xanthine and Co dehydrogenase maturation factor [Tengunoibacter tsumagoiensis]